jgi:predicted nucleic acid-binding protein
MGITFDTGALIGLTRRQQSIQAVWEAARESEETITLPAVVLAEWWRARSDANEKILRGCKVEPLDTILAKAAGEVLATLKDAGLVDVIVVASAARRGDIVYTSDVDDLLRIQQACFPGVRIRHA